MRLQGKYQEAVPYFKKALEIEPYFSTYSNLGTCYFFLKQYANAVEMFEKAVTFNRARHIDDGKHGRFLSIRGKT